MEINDTPRSELVTLVVLKEGSLGWYPLAALWDIISVAQHHVKGSPGALVMGGNGEGALDQLCFAS
jgi:hypothetical protein